MGFYTADDGKMGDIEEVWKMEFRDYGLNFKSYSFGFEVVWGA